MKRLFQNSSFHNPLVSNLNFFFCVDHNFYCKECCSGQKKFLLCRRRVFNFLQISKANPMFYLRKLTLIRLAASTDRRTDISYWPALLPFHILVVYLKSASMSHWQKVAKYKIGCLCLYQHFSNFSFQYQYHIDIVTLK